MPMATFREPADHNVDDGREKNSKKRHTQHAAKDRCAEGLTHLGTGARSEDQRDDARRKANEVMRMGRKRSRPASIDT